MLEFSLAYAPVVGFEENRDNRNMWHWVMRRKRDSPIQRSLSDSKPSAGLSPIPESCGQYMSFEAITARYREVLTLLVTTLSPHQLQEWNAMLALQVVRYQLFSQRDHVAALGTLKKQSGSRRRRNPLPAPPLGAIRYPPPQWFHSATMAL